MGLKNVNYKQQFFYFCIFTKKLINMSAKIQVLEKLNKTDHRDIQIQTEEFKGKPISVLHYKVRKEHLTLLKQTNFNLSSYLTGTTAK